MASCYTLQQLQLIYANKIACLMCKIFIFIGVAVFIRQCVHIHLYCSVQETLMQFLLFSWQKYAFVCLSKVTFITFNVLLNIRAKLSVNHNVFDYFFAYPYTLTIISVSTIFNIVHINVIYFKFWTFKLSTRFSIVIKGKKYYSYQIDSFGGLLNGQLYYSYIA